MGNVMRHRYGAKNPVLAEIASATVIEVGDLTYLASNKVLPFWTKANASIADINDLFLGVAMQASANGEDLHSRLRKRSRDTSACATQPATVMVTRRPPRAASSFISRRRPSSE